MPRDVVRGPGDRGQAQRMRRVQQMEAMLAPQEFMDEFASIYAGGDEAEIAAVRDSFSGRDLAAQTTLTPYRSVVLADCAVLYKGAEDAKGRNLLVGFAGKKNRLMLPAPMFLQRMAAKEWDVLILRDQTGQHFRLGAGEIAPSFPDLAAWIFAVASPYQRTVAFGTSMGALAAVRLALFAPNIRAIAVGARPAIDISRLFMPGRRPPAFDPVCACLVQAQREILFVHSEGHAEDAGWASALAAQSGGLVVAVPGDTHGSIFDLWLRGRLQAFLTSVLASGQMDEVLVAAKAAVTA